jgi:hypothetical protein
VAGYIAALIKGPTWVAEVVIAPQEVGSQKTPSFAGLGVLGGIVASELNMSGNASLEKIDLILNSREFGAKLTEKYSLLPEICKYQWPKVYKKFWDPARNTWSPKYVPPTPLEIGNFIKIKYLKKSIDDKVNTISLKIQSKDSTFSLNLATKYVEFLNEYLKTTVQNEARENVSYLDSQLVRVVDPLLKEKILGLISNEIEKEMVVSKEAFRVVDPIYLSKTFKQKKIFPIVFGFGLLFICCLIIVFYHAFSSFEKTDADKELLKKIKKEMSLLPGSVNKIR